MTHLFCIVDRSGSMAGLEKSTIEGYNEYVDNLRKEKNMKITTVLFDHEIITVSDNKPIKDSPKLDNEIYTSRGSTALIDAVCRTINERKSKVKKADKALVLIITDGLENSSREYTNKDMHELVKSLETQGNWTFTYLGANQDAWATAQTFGLQLGNVANYNSTKRGTEQAYGSMTTQSLNWARSSTSGTGAFYAQEKEKLEDAK